MQANDATTGASGAVRCKLVGYLRVSTRQQGESGLGLAAQQAAIAKHVEATGCELVGTFTEVESGKRSDRPQLRRALGHAKRCGATLVVAKLDRLSRNVAFLSALMESRVPFVCCDNPNATPVTLHILVAIAEDEAKRISARTKAALAVYKTERRVSKRVREMYQGNVPAEVLEARAGKLGADLVGCGLTDEDRDRGRQVMNARRREQATAEVADLLPEMKTLWEGGATLRGIADKLNAENHVTRQNKAWTAVQVMRALRRAGVDTARKATTEGASA